MSLTVVILTFNEAQHIARAIQSVQGVAGQIVVVDSGSTDATANIARDFGATVLVHPFVNQAEQLNWALTQLPEKTDWVFRLDADEVVSPELANSLTHRLPGLGPEIVGGLVNRRIHFLGRPIKWGGVFPVRMLRLFRHGHGHCENRWMDEHIIVEGGTAEFAGEIIDDNLNSLNWWTEKHNSYASREVVDILNQQYNFMPQESVARLRGGQQAGIKRWIKENVYAGLPGGLRAFAYFFYRYVLRLGFLDGKEGTAFHVLQGFWYRYLVDMKLHEVRKYLKNNSVDVETAIKDVLGIDLRPRAKNY